MTGGDVSKRAVRILQWNVDSLLSKKDEFKQVLKKLDVDIE